MPTYQELVAALLKSVPQVDPAGLKAALEGASPPLLLDVRELDEVDQGRIAGSLHIPRGQLELKIEARVADRATPIVAYDAGGSRSLFAAESLKRLGYSDVRSLSGGFLRWKNSGYAVDVPRRLSDGERKRYARHLAMPEVGEAGQLKLLKAKVLLVGAGGLGCPAALYLAAAGVGTIGIADFDVVDESNLQRQVLHTTDRVGTPKVESARKSLLALNPGIDVRAHAERIDRDNVDRIFEGYDLVVDGSDNFATRYLVNDACVKHRIPNVHGSIFRFEGQVTVFWPGKGPCYRCLYPEPTPAELAPG